ncbi:MAG TPA: hypothetical protein DCL83_06945, partial [Arthrobacter bacterium]|nr:hypothetical protein [Arthrobacter sp.]
AGTITVTGGALAAVATWAGTVSNVRLGGDTITVTGGGGPASPLVLYGDTSQDGVWYGGDPTHLALHNFGPKPMPHIEGANVTLGLST